MHKRCMQARRRTYISVCDMNGSKCIYACCIINCLIKLADEQTNVRLILIVQRFNTLHYISIIIESAVCVKWRRWVMKIAENIRSRGRRDNKRLPDK